MSTGLKPYKYDPLRPGHIRLLNLFPGTGREELVIELEQRRINANPEYEALSYAWGSPRKLETVLVAHLSRVFMERFKRHISRGLHHVTVRPVKLSSLIVWENLSVALRQLRREDRVRVLWVDAVCIDQANDEEKDIEVARMGEIYRHARQVVVWLGEESGDSGLAVSALIKIGLDVEYDRVGDDYPWSVKSESELERLQNNPMDIEAAGPSWAAINRLLQRPWFSRLWVLQEIQLASKAVVVVGRSEMAWEMLRGAILWIGWGFVVEGFLLPFFDEPTIQGLDPFLQVLDYFGLTGLSLFTMHTQCSDPRDRIYAVLSLLDQRVASHITPDYSQSVLQVYTHTVLAEMQVWPELDSLWFCTFPAATSSATAITADPAWPSWVPNFSIITPALRWSALSLAAGHSGVDILYDAANATLGICGRTIDTISFISTPVPSDTPFQEAMQICREWEPVDASTDEYIAGGRLIDAFVSAVTAEYVFDGAFNGILVPGSQQLVDEHSDHVAGKEFQNVTQSGFSSAIYSFVKGRAMFRTTRGYLGICPASAKVGDEICLALGSRLPLILRPTLESKTCHQVGGACYVSGLGSAEGLLGKLPPGWSHTLHLQGGFTTIDFCSPEGERTQLDPRAGPLPDGWEVVDGFNGEDKHLERRRMFFRNVNTGKETDYDPRLTSANLRSLGIELQNIVLV